MQNEKTLQQLTREYESNMPPEIMELINTFDWKRELRTISLQNQLMADVAADLEQSVYLMLLGVVKVSELFERMIDVHELSEDRTKKVLEEVDNKIFTVLHKKLTELEEKEAEPVILKPVSTPKIATATLASTTNEDRDSILAEIEKEETPSITINPIVKPVIENKASEPVLKPTPSIGVIAPKADVSTSNTIQNPGVAKPFSFNTEKTIVTEEPKVLPKEVVKGIQPDPVAAGLNKATVMTAPINSVQSNAGTPPTPKAPDPYREPIE